MPFVVCLPQELLVGVQKEYFQGLDRFSFWLSVGAHWEYGKNPVNGEWTLYEPEEGG
ncbi:hypothetical protein GYMLUDRAFT_689839 [Collybiopsis luxurians FD-317 M1]|uniref:Uncharacterized protein n=1 Tax=Collybiopsis luxurians FD-317 M1 TaxID=944289 RepID=A0A0D0B5W2_9AGAR|nr:hypothetical protein GYMLUDRAFT_689839 [Collybiopsis luxurians FD-317 M1]